MPVSDGTHDRPCPPDKLEKPDRVVLWYNHYKGGVVVDITDTDAVGGVVWQPEDVNADATCREGNPKKGGIHAHRPTRVDGVEPLIAAVSAATAAASAAAAAASAAAASAAAIAAALRCAPEQHIGTPRMLMSSSGGDDDSLLPPTCYWVGGQLVCC